MPQAAVAAPARARGVERTWDVAVIGAGVFGVWTAYHLRQQGLRVVLVEARAPGHTRSSSGGESRLIRVGYGPHAHYSRLSLAALRDWRALARRSGQPLFHETGVLFLAPRGDAYARASRQTLQALSVPHELLDPRALRRRYPQCRFPGTRWGLLEPRSGVLLARRAVQALAHELVASGVTLHHAAVPAPWAGPGLRRLARLELNDGTRLAAGAYVFACGPWLPHLFPHELGGRIVPTRQELFFYGLPPGDRRFEPGRLPAWVDFGAGVYGTPNLEGRGLKLAFDTHGAPFDPEHGDRRPSPLGQRRMRAVLAERFPDLARAPLLETRVCQYENTCDGELLADRHPRHDNVWLAGGGSGHGFKLAPAFGRHVARLVTGRARPQPRFALAAKLAVRQRRIF